MAILPTMQSRDYPDAVTGELVGQIQEFVTEPDAADCALKLMAQHMNAGKAALVRLAPDPLRDRVLGSFGMSTELVDDLLGARKDPDWFLAQDASWTPGRISTDTEHRTQVNHCRHLQQTLLEPNDIEHTLIGIIHSDPDLHVLFWLHRNAAAGPFRLQEQSYIEQLMPHWQRTIRQKLTLDHRHSAVDVAEMVINEAPFGLFILNDNGTLLRASHNAKRFHETNDGITIKDRMLLFSDRDTRRQFDELFQLAKDGGAEAAKSMKPFTVQKSGGNGTYQVGVKPMQLPERRGSLAHKNVIVVYVYDTSSRIPVNTESLRALYKLTDAEARVCGLLYLSYNLPDVARQLSVSINTIKTHLNRIYRKLGVQTQAELVRKLAAQLYVG